MYREHARARRATLSYKYHLGILTNELSAPSGSFADTELKPNAGTWDKEHKFPTDAVKQMAEMGLMGVAQSTDYVRQCVMRVCANMFVYVRVWRRGQIMRGYA